MCEAPRGKSFAIRPVRRALLFRACAGLLGAFASLYGTGAIADGQETPERVRDLGYGTVLFEYFQGNAFEALSALAVAEARGGIQGHGDDPQLVEGGLMLSYGMTREAKAQFEKVLKDGVSPSKRNQAWFYLGKVFYLEADSGRAAEALARVDSSLLEEEAPELYNEWLYLNGQLALGHNEAKVMEIVATMPPGNLWRAYLVYNQAVQRISTGKIPQAIADLEQLAADLHAGVEAEGDREEALALRERVLLSQGQLYLQQGHYAEARASLQKIDLDSPFSDQALFHYAVAASHAQDYGIALQALDTLHKRPLFTPWLQQIPYARGFVHEQLKNDKQALQAYKEAARHYQTLIQQLAEERERLSEARIIEALRFDQPDPQADAKAQTTAAPAASRITLGEADIQRDPYGRLRVKPADFSLAALLASEPFQLGLRDLHELYRLKDSLSRWERQLSSFDLMLETRAQQRARRIEQTQAALVAQKADQWIARQADYNEQISRAVAQDDIAFFMSDEQKAFDAKIQAMLGKLETLPDDESTARHRERAKRIKAYFDWWVADQYSVNRWAAQSQLRGLNLAMDEFNRQTAGLEQEMASDDRHQALVDRVRHNQQNLDARRLELEQALTAARGVLVEQVRAELARQESEVQSYLRAARHAQARLSDALFQAAPGVQPVPAGQARPIAPEQSKSAGEVE